MKNISKDKIFLNIFLTVVLSFLVESYITLVENSNLIFEFSKHNFINLFSTKEFIIFLLIFSIIFYILFDENRKLTVFNFLYKYRLPLSFTVIIVAVMFQIHGSSINELNIFNVKHKPLIGISRAIRSDEFIVNTLFAFSQYPNNFSYFSEIVRGISTDMFIIYGQPILDIGTIFRPFLIGYLFLNQGQGLSFFWIGRLVFLFLISFEFGMLLTNKNKILSLAYAILITFSPVVQWWFAINGLVEQLIFGQLSILLINWYMQTNDYKKRILIAFGLMISVGTFALVFYPSWQIPFAYTFILLGSWIFLKNWNHFKFNKKDLIIFICYLSIFSIIMMHIFYNSFETIKLTLNTVYPGSEVFNGGGSLKSLTYYIPSIFFPIDDVNLLQNTCEYSVFVDLFPIPLILTSIALFYQKTKDKLLIGLLILYAILLIFYFVQLPDFLIYFTLRSKIRTTRLFTILSFIGVLILIRSLSNLKELKNKKFILTLSLLVSSIWVYLSTLEFNSYYLDWMPTFAIIFYFIVFSSCLFATSKKNQNIFLICIIFLSLLTGALVNPIDYGTDVIFKSNYFHQVEKIIENNPNGLWIIEHERNMVNINLPAGAKTINSVNTYPNIKTWKKIDTNNSYENIYNRYAHILFNIQEINETYFELLYADCFIVHINVNDLKKLNVSYITTTNNLKNLSNENVKFEKIYKYKQYNIFKVKYN